MTLAYFDCFSGASGDMILGALVDAGACIDVIRERLDGLPVSGYTLSAQKTRKDGFSATQVRVDLDDSQETPHRHLATVKSIIASGGLPNELQARVVAVFERLAQAEARAHGTTVEQVHFHEVGAVDAIVDVVGAVIALHELGVSRVLCSAIPTGSGTVECAHGTMAGARAGTMELLKGVPLLATDEPGELTTPTGAAILTTLAESFGPIPGMTVQHAGYGAGRREGRHRPNLLRVLLGEASSDSTVDEIAVLECCLDDVSSETIGIVRETAGCGCTGSLHDADNHEEIAPGSPADGACRARRCNADARDHFCGNDHVRHSPALGPGARSWNGVSRPLRRRSVRSGSRSAPAAARRAARHRSTRIAGGRLQPTTSR